MEPLGTVLGSFFPAYFGLLAGIYETARLPDQSIQMINKAVILTAVIWRLAM